MNTPLQQAAYDIGAKGSEPIEEERLAFESWMRGHCWAVIGEWDGKQYKHAHESTEFVHGGAMETRRLWAAWRDRGAVARVLAGQAQEVGPVIDFTVLYEFADNARISYNELCTTVRLANRRSCEHGSVESLYNPNPVEYQYHYPDGSWRCSNGEVINGMHPDRARSLYALKDNT